MMASKGEIIVHGLIWSFFLVGLYDVLVSKEENACEMTYMYEKPQYKQVPLVDEISNRYPHYGLYLYGEGNYFNVVSDLQLEGIPVLYIPGNTGSKKQCRSVGSVLLRKAQDRKWDVHFNVFTVDLNEEIVAFYGGTLNDQVEFVHHSIKAILKLYKNAKIQPQSVIIVGHSMGGVVARGLFALPDFDLKTINVVYTLASPHVHPIFSLDPHIAKFYDNVNKYWRENCEKLKDVTLVSLSGGDNDFQVNGAVTRLPSCLNNSVSTATTDVPKAWVSADHLCAAWCKQIVLATTRSMFDMIDPKTKQISSDAAFRSKVAQYHFVHNSGILKFSNIVKGSKVKLLASHVIKTASNSEWSSTVREIGEEPAYYIFDLNSMQEQGKVLAVARTTTTSERWVLACDNPECKSATDMSAKGYLTPKFKVVKLNITQLIQDGFSRLIFKLPKQTNYAGQIDVNFLSFKDLDKQHTVPHIFSNLWTLNHGYALNDTIGNTKGRFYHQITLSGLYSIFHAYKFIFLQEVASEENKTVLLELELPNQPANSYSAANEMTVKLRNTAGDQVPVLHVYTDGQTEYSIRVKVQFMQLLGQILRFDGAIIPTMVALNGMLALSYQLKILLSGKKCISTSEAHGISAKPYKVQPFINLAKKLYTYQWFYASWHYVGLPVPDAVRLDDEFGIWFALLPLVLFLYGTEIYSLLLFIETKLIQIFGSLFGRYLGLTVAEDWRPSFLSSTVHTVILATLVTQSGCLAFLYICVLNFADLCGLSITIPQTEEKKISEKNENGGQKAVSGKKNSKKNENGDLKAESDKENSENEYSDLKTESVEKSPSAEEDCKTEKDEIQSQDSSVVNYNIKLSMHQLWICLVVLTLPSLIARAKGYSFHAADPSTAPAIFGSLIFLLHRQQDAAVQPSTARKVVCRLLYPLTILTSMLCLHAIHRLPYFVLSFLSVFIAMQYFG